MPVRIFVSHAGQDTNDANRIAEGLRKSGHDVNIDTHHLRIGDNVIAFINESIDKCDYMVHLLSHHSADAVWQKAEQDAAIWTEIQNKGITNLVVRIADCKIPPLLGPKLFHDAPNGIATPSELERLINVICTRIRTIHTKPSETVSDALSMDTDNPFRHIRAEHLERDPNALVDAFAPLDSLRMGKFHGMHPCFLEGPRGTGKSMLLLSIRARNFLSLPPSVPPRDIIFGFYLKLNPGPLCNTGILIDSSDTQAQDYIQPEDVPALRDISCQEIILSLCESLVAEVEYCCNKSLLSANHEVQQKLCNSISNTLLGSTDQQLAHSFSSLRGEISLLHRKIARYVRERFTYRTNTVVPVLDLDITTIVTVITHIRKYVAELQDAMFVALIDEYENLTAYQQRAVNTIIKFAVPSFSVKVAKKIGISDSPGTFSGSELQETHDYSRILLVYEVCSFDNRREYRTLLSSIVEKQMQLARLPYNDISELLPTSDDIKEGLAEQHIVSELKGMEEERNRSSGRARDRLQENTANGHYREAAVYRAIAKLTGRQKHFSGFDRLAFLSSGVIRYFQEILGVAYYLTSTDSSRSRETLSLPPRVQSEAVHIVSDSALTTLSKNVEHHGEALKMLLIDLGGCLRQKLLKHVSEPEAARVTIIDHELLGRKEFSLLRTILDVGVREGVFQTREGRPAFLPKHGSDPQAVEFNICRILAPSLQISPRLRWRTRVTANVLNGLLDTDIRKASRSQLLRDVLANRVADGLFFQLELESNEDPV